MQLLHIVTPSHPSTTPELLGLIRLTQQQLGGTHNTIVNGSSAEASFLRKCGISVLGSVDGPVNVSRTLAKRVGKLIVESCKDDVTNIIAWGWHAASILSGAETSINAIAFVDGIDRSVRLHVKNKLMLIPTSWDGTSCLKQMGIKSTCISEPLIGVEPTTIVASQSVVQDILGLDDSVHVVALVGNTCSWREVLDMVFRIKTMGERVVFVLAPHYVYRSQLMLAAKKRGLENVVIDTPPALRLVDVCAFADCAWAPSVAEFDASCCVLDVLKAACQDVPLAVQSSHQVSSIPAIGAKIAWARDVLDVSSWILDIVRGSTEWVQDCSEVTTSVRTIAAPSRFIQGLAQRISTTSTL